MGIVDRLGRAVFNATPPYSHKLYTFCARYVDRFNADNNPDEGTNGELVFLRRTLAPLSRGVVFDVGANVGNWLAMALAINPALDYHCFEPSRATCAALAQRAWPANVRINNCGLSDAAQTMTLHVVGDGNGMNSLYARQGVDGFEERTTEQIQLMTLDEYCAAHAVTRIDLVKIDVEGHELRVLRGASRMLSGGAIGAVQFEYGGCNLDSRTTLADLWQLLAGHGFDLYKLYPEGPRRVERYHQSVDSFKYSNWVALPRAVAQANGDRG